MSELSKPCVLILEDEAELASSLQAKLITEGFRVLVADDVLRASQMIRNQKFYCIVLDYRLKDGTSDVLVTTMRKKRDQVNFSTPILFISANLDADVLQKVGGNINGALVKPFGLSEFAEKVKSFGGGPRPLVKASA